MKNEYTGTEREMRMSLFGILGTLTGAAFVAAALSCLPLFVQACGTNGPGAGAPGDSTSTLALVRAFLADQARGAKADIALVPSDSGACLQWRVTLRGGFVIAGSDPAAAFHVEPLCASWSDVGNMLRAHEAKTMPAPTGAPATPKTKGAR